MSTSKDDAFSRALKHLSMPELQPLFEALAADREPRHRLASHIKLEWFRNLPTTEMSRVWLGFLRDGLLDVPPDLLPVEHNTPALDSAGLSHDGPHERTREGGG